MASFTSNFSQQKELFSITLCKCPRRTNSFKFHSSAHVGTFAARKHALPTCFSPLVVRAHANHIDPKWSSTDQEISKKSVNPRTGEQTFSVSSHFWNKDKRDENVSLLVEEVIGKFEEVGLGAGKGTHTGERLDYRKRKKIGHGFSSSRTENETLGKKLSEIIGSVVENEEEKKNSKKGVDNKSGMEKMEKGAKKSKVVSPQTMFRYELDMCSKKADVMGALKLYDSAQREGIKMEQYHFTVLLYLCSSAATGVVHAAKSGSGSGNRSLSTVDSTCDVSLANSADLGEVDEISKGSRSIESTNQESSNGLLAEAMNHSTSSDRIVLDSDGVPTEEGKYNLDSCFNGKEKLVHVSNGVAKVKDATFHLGTGDYASKDIKDGRRPETYEIRVSEDFKKYALRRGFEIYEKMCFEKIPMNEASFTSVARMAQAMGDGDMAFDAVKKMKALGITPRLRSYGPALFAFCTCGDIDKAFAVEEHMLEQGVHPEEPELEALLRLSTESGRSDKVYYLLHKLRTCVRKVSHYTADLLEKWFKSKVASRVGKRKLDQRLIREAIENGGGGWHGQGWMGKGKWAVTHTTVGTDGLCKGCGEKLATIDLDLTETEKFAESVASIAIQNEKESSFQQFQRWLDYYGPFEAVIDGANVGLKNQKNFSPSKVWAVVNEIRQVLPSRKWPLIVLHNRRITGRHMDKPVNKTLIAEWKNANALYATPTGSNDDWYWLYAAIQCKCLIVTNDKMRDHLFQLLGNDFFPKWKERHQVHFDFTDTSPVIYMPPPCSVVIQESEKGHWHIPIASEHDYKGAWLCVTRANSPEGKPVPATRYEGDHDNHADSKLQPREIHQDSRNLLSPSDFSGYPTILPQIEAAEKLGSCVIDFEI